MLTAGDLRHRVTIQTTPEVSDGHGGFTEGTPVSVHARIPARVTPLLGRDLENAKQIDPRVSHSVSVRYWINYRTDLKGGRAHLVYHDFTDRTFEIVAPPTDVEERHVEVALLCRESA